MVSKTLQSTLEQNRKHLEDVLEALDAEHKMADDPEKGGKIAAEFFGSKRSEMTEEERTAWLFEENAKALAAAAQAAT
ncbi:hypothetical protein, partial [Haloarcula onubensis]